MSKPNEPITEVSNMSMKEFNKLTKKQLYKHLLAIKEFAHGYEECEHLAGVECAIITYRKIETQDSYQDWVENGFDEEAEPNHPCVGCFLMELTKDFNERGECIRAQRSKIQVLTEFNDAWTRAQTWEEMEGSGEGEGESDSSEVPQ